MDKTNEAAQGAVQVPVASPAPAQPKQLNESDALALLKAKRDAAAAKTTESPKAADDGADAAPVKGTADDKPEEAGEAKGAADSDGENGEETEGNDEPTYAAKVNGEVRQVPVSELLQVYSSAKHLQTKQAEILTREREVGQRLEQVNGLANRYEQQLGSLAQAMQPNVPTQAQLQQLLNEATNATDANVRAAANTRYLQAKEAIDRLAAVQAETQRVQGERLAREKADNERFEAEQAELLKKANPDFTNPQYVQKTISYLKQLGFNDEHIASIQEHGAWLLIDKARKWDERNAAIGSGVRKAIKEAKVLSPTNTQEKPDPKAQERLAARAALKAKPSFNNALAAMKAGR